MGADPALHCRNDFQRSAPANPAFPVAVFRIEDIILFHSELFVELKLTRHLSHPIAGRKHLEDDLWSDPALLPLPVGTAISFRSAQGHEDVGRADQLVVALDWIPKRELLPKVVDGGVEKGGVRWVN